MADIKYPSPRNVMRQFFYRIGTEACADVAEGALEAEEYAETLGNKNAWYWAGYRDCAAALAETITRMATDEVKQAVEEICDDWAAAKREREARSREARNAPKDLHIGGPEDDDGGLWDNLEGVIGPIS